MRFVFLLGLLVAHPAVGWTQEGSSRQLLGDPFTNIFNGTLSRDFPAVVAVLVINDDGSALCSGTLIAPRVVLTAAHCFASGVADGFAAVFADGRTRRDYTAVALIPHPRYRTTRLQNDVGLMLLAEPVTDVVPLPLSERSPRLGRTGTIVGYGDDGRNGSSRKRVGSVRLRRCPRAVRVEGGTVRLKKLLCWRFSSSTSDTCSGDSGGPLLVNGTVAGVHSGGIGTASCPTSLSFDTNVVRYRSWIDSVLRQRALQ